MKQTNAKVRPHFQPAVRCGWITFHFPCGVYRLAAMNRVQSISPISKLWYGWVLTLIVSFSISFTLWHIQDELNTYVKAKASCLWLWKDECSIELAGGLNAGLSPKCGDSMFPLDLWKPHDFSQKYFCHMDAFSGWLNICQRGVSGHDKWNETNRFDVIRQ